MNRKQKWVLAGVAALIAAVPATWVVREQVEAAQRSSLERAAQRIFQHDAGLPTATWRSGTPPVGKVWDKAVSEAVVTGVERRDGGRAEVWVNETTTPYAVDRSGGNREWTVPQVASHLFLFAPSGDGWRLAEDLTDSASG
ncbi:hypothetical protein OHT61_13760 [Streptomyces sp. NBC_00178]|uniref:hypothetical protein n=1 Tax=Streptomyces sp. NBC_00178 TaxID=2975672 RepID=UPI002E2A80DD|nr:hypothetical protein [Streptomyces sp. NBC_00178]